MCQFCLKHGEGKKWYLRAANYSDELLSDVRRRKFIERFLTEPDQLREAASRLEQLDRAPKFLRGLIGRIAVRRMKKVHYGQVVPIEDVERIFDFVNSIVRVACICRYVKLGREKRYCYGLSLAPDGGQLMRISNSLDGSFLKGPDMQGMESLSKAEALAVFREHEAEGLCHTVWTFHTPFIGGICNCDRADCMALRCTIGHGVPILFRAEYVAEVAPDACTGCRQCMSLCQFGAMFYSASDEKAAVDQKMCYGCGICRSACPADAISLRDRREVPAVAALW